MKYIYSTLSNDQNFVEWVTDPKAKKLPKQQKAILIAGKANVANKKNFITPKGVMTSVGDEEYKALAENSAFKRFLDRGYITVESKKADIEAAVKNMKAKDKSAALTKQDVKKNTTAKVTTNKED